MKRRVFLTSIDVTNASDLLTDLPFIFGVANGVCKSGSCKFHIIQDSTLKKANILMTMTDIEYDRFKEIIENEYPTQCMFDLY